MAYLDQGNIMLSAPAVHISHVVSSTPASPVPLQSGSPHSPSLSTPGGHSLETEQFEFINGDIFGNSLGSNFQRSAVLVPLTPQRPGSFASNVPSPVVVTSSYNSPAVAIGQTPLLHTGSASSIPSAPHSPLNASMSSNHMVPMAVTPAHLTYQTGQFLTAGPPTARNLNVWPESPLYLPSPFSSPHSSCLNSLAMNYSFPPFQFQGNSYSASPNYFVPRSSDVGFWNRGAQEMPAFAGGINFTPFHSPSDQGGWSTAFQNGLTFDRRYSHFPPRQHAQMTNIGNNFGHWQNPAPSRNRQGENKSYSDKVSRVKVLQQRVNRGKSEDSCYSVPEKSPLLRAVEGNKWETVEVPVSALSNENILELAMDKSGSRYLQRKLDRAGTECSVFPAVMENALQLSCHLYGNYVVQKFITRGNQCQRNVLIDFVIHNFRNLSHNRHGCRIVQSAISAGNSNQQGQILKEMENDGHLIESVMDQNKNHVVQIAIKDAKDKAKVQFIVDAVIGQPSKVRQLSEHPFGCRVIQQIVEHCPEKQKFPVVDILIINLRHLIMDQYGNYVIQRVLEHGTKTEIARICAGIRGSVIRLSQHKHASPVVEKCLEATSSEDRRLLIQEILNGSSFSSHDRTWEEESVLEYMLKDQFANYVVQKMLEVSCENQRVEILKQMKPAIANLRRFNYGKHVIAKLQKYFTRLCMSTEGGGAIGEA